MFGLGRLFRRVQQIHPDNDMDWNPTTPPPQPPIYPTEQYVPGGYPLTPPNQTANVFARPASPYWIVSEAKRVCRGLSVGSKFAWKSSTTIGKGVGIGLQVGGRYTLRGSKAVASYAQTSTTSILQNWQAQNRRNNTSPRNRRASIMRAREQAAKEQRLRDAETLKKNLEETRRQQELQTWSTNDMVWGPHYDEHDRFVPNPTFLGYRAPKETAIFPADDPNTQLDRELVAAIPVSHRFISTPKPVKKYQRKDRVSRPYDLLAMRQTREARREVRKANLKKYAEDDTKSAPGREIDYSAAPHTPSPILDNTDSLKSPDTPTGRIKTTEVHPETRSPTYEQSDSPKSPTTPTGRVQVEEVHPDTSKATLEKPGTLTGQVQTIEAAPDASKETIESPTTPVGTSKTTEHHTVPRAASPALSDISSTCDINTPPRFILPLRKVPDPVADAVGSPSTPAPIQVAQKAPSPRLLLSAGAYSPPGAWIEDGQATTGWDEIGLEEIPTPTRRDVSEEPPITPQKQIQQQHQVDELKAPDSKSGHHGTTRKSVKTKVVERQVAAQSKRLQFNITPLSAALDEQVEHHLTHGISNPGIKGLDLAPSDIQRLAVPRSHRGSHDNWLNDEVINSYLKIVADYGVNLSGRTPDKPPSHFAFNSFFFSKLSDPSQGIKSIARWVKRARIDSLRLLDLEMLFIPINSGMHWTLAVVSGTQRTITYYDSLGGSGTAKLNTLLKWVEAELGSVRGAFKREEWQLINGKSGRQANSDDCGVFTVTNARSLVLGMVPEEAFGPELALVQRRRIVAELAGGEFLVAGS